VQACARSACDLRRTLATRMAAHGVPMRALQEMMSHRDLKTTLIYADYAPSAREAEWVEAAFSVRHETATRQWSPRPHSATHQLLLRDHTHDVPA
jgi:hypothetical protein